MKLSARQVATEKPADKVRTLSDGKGLYLVIKPTGAKLWRFRYYRPTGQRNMISLGHYPEVSLSKAREKCDDCRRQLKEGVDPAQKKAEAKAVIRDESNRFGAIAREWHENMVHRWKPGSSKPRVTWGTLNNHVLPYFADRIISEITPMEWLELLKRMERAGIGEQRDRVLSMCRNIYKLAIVTGRAQYNPLADITVALRPHKSKNMAHVSGEELPQLVADMANYSGNVVVKRGLQIQLLTALRPSELRLGRWHEIDFDNAVWTIPGERMKTGKEHLVPLPRQAVSMLNSLKPLNGHFEHIFVVRSDDVPITDSTMSKALRIMGYQGRHVPHGTRHLVATQLKELGYPGEWIEAQLSHKLPGIAGVYTHAVHMSPEQRPAMMQAWADYLEEVSGQDFLA